MNNIIIIDIRYCSTPLVYGNRFEVSITVYYPWLFRSRDWEVYSFSAKPTPRQIRAVKRHFSKRIGA